MQHFTECREIEKSLAQELIFNGCRANPMREVKHVDYGCYVMFVKCANNTHEAYLKSAAGYLLAVANVDEFDV